MDKKIPYNKKKSTKQWGTGGPRDIQRRQAAAFEKGTATLQLPPLNVEELKQLLLEQKKEEGPINLDGVGLTYTEAEEKIQQAVKATVEEERKKYEHGLQDLNDQLNAAKTKMSVIEETLVNKNAEVSKLKTQITEASTTPPYVEDQLKEKSTEINGLKMKLVQVEAQLKTKGELLDKFTINHTTAMGELKSGILELSGKLSEGQVSALIKTIERPEIQDNVFIDPIESESDLDPHIKIKADDVDTSGVSRNVKDDLAKLKGLLGK